MASPPSSLGLLQAKDDASPRPAKRMRRCQRPHICPQPGSLYHIMHDYSGVGLFVPPILWTDVHTKALNIAFTIEPAITTPAPKPQSFGVPPSPPPEPCEVARNLCGNVSTFVDRPTMQSGRSRALKQLVAGFYPDMPCKVKTGVELELQFGSNYYGRGIKLPLVWKKTTSRSNSFDSAATCPLSPSSQESRSSGASLGGGEETDAVMELPICGDDDDDAPMLAFIDRDHLATTRKQLYRVPVGPTDGDRQNTPVRNLQILRSKSLTPVDADCDAYYIPILLAMAQQRFYRSTVERVKYKLNPDQPREEKRAAMHDVEVRLITADTEEKDLIVYTAVVSADFLRGFDDPARPLQTYPGPSMRVSYTKVPAWPFYGLKERLGKALGPKIVGREFFGEGYDTYHSYNDVHPVQDESKFKLSRRRTPVLDLDPATMETEVERRLNGCVKETQEAEKRGKKRSFESAADDDDDDDGARAATTPPSSKRQRGSGIVQIF